MPVEVTMPKFGLTMQEGTIQRYFKAPGEAVRAGEPLYEVETEKVLYEVEAPASGTLAAALFPEGATVECGVVIAVIAESGEDATAVGARYGNGATPAGAPAASAGAPAGAAAARQGAASSAAGSSAAASAADDPERAAPSARSRASSPPNSASSSRASRHWPRRPDHARGRRARGRSRALHVWCVWRECARRERSIHAAARAGAPAGAPVRCGGASGAGKSPARSVPMRGMRKTIADRMSAKSARECPAHHHQRGRRHPGGRAARAPRPSIRFHLR